MENQDRNTELWVDERLAALDAEPAPRADAAAALARLGVRRRRVVFLKRAVWAGATAAAAIAALLVLQAPKACATPRGCAVHWWYVLFPSQAAPEIAGIPPYKVEGRADAPLTCELFTDYECPACARFYSETVPLLIQDFVRTGKVKLIHRDYPLNIHEFSRLAAKYADAAGQSGHYHAAVARLFETQQVWKTFGDIAPQLAGIVPNLDRIVQSDPSLDATIDADLAQGRRDRIMQTPELVVVWKGTRQPIAPIPDYPRLKAYLDEFR